MKQHTANQYAISPTFARNFDVRTIGEFKELYKEKNKKPTGRLEELAKKKAGNKGPKDSFDVDRFYEAVFDYALGNGLTAIRDITRAVGFEPHGFMLAVQRGTLTLRQASKLADWADLKLDDYVIKEFG